MKTRMSTVLNSTYLTLSNMASALATTKTPLPSGLQARGEEEEEEEKRRQFKRSASRRNNTVAACYEPHPPPLPPSPHWFHSLPRLPPRHKSPSLLTPAYLSAAERLRRSMELAENSGYSTDSSGWGDLDFDPEGGEVMSGLLDRPTEFKSLDNPYDEIRGVAEREGSLTCSDTASREGEGQEEEPAEDQIYEEISNYSNTNAKPDTDDDNSDTTDQATSPIPLAGRASAGASHAHLQVSHSVPEGHYSMSLPRPRHRRAGLSPPPPPAPSPSHLTSGFSRAPTLPPRPRLRKLASLDPGAGQSRRKQQHHLRREPVSGVSLLKL